MDYHIQPFTEEDVAQYIHHRIQLSGGARPLFSPQACALTYRLSQGNPRLINQVCEMALTYGFAQQAPRITAKLLAQAALDRRKNRILPRLSLRISPASLPLREKEEPERPELAGELETADEPRLTAGTNEETVSAETLLPAGKWHFESPRSLLPQLPGSSRRHKTRVSFCDHSAKSDSATAHSVRFPQAVAAFRNACADYNAPRQQSLSVRYLLGRTLEQLGTGQRRWSSTG